MHRRPWFFRAGWRRSAGPATKMDSQIIRHLPQIRPDPGEDMPGVSRKGIPNPGHASTLAGCKLTSIPAPGQRPDTLRHFRRVFPRQAAVRTMMCPNRIGKIRLIEIITRSDRAKIALWIKSHLHGDDRKINSKPGGSRMGFLHLGDIARVFIPLCKCHQFSVIAQILRISFLTMFQLRRWLGDVPELPGVPIRHSHKPLAVQAQNGWCRADLGFGNQYTIPGPSDPPARSSGPYPG